MPDSQTLLSTLFVEAFRTLAPKRAVPEVDVRYYPYAGLNHTIRLRSGRVSAPPPPAAGPPPRPPPRHFQDRAARRPPRARLHPRLQAAAPAQVAALLRAR